MFLLSLDEIDRVKRANKLRTLVDLEDVTGVTRKTWRDALNTREPKPAVLQALAQLGARPNKILVLADIPVAVAA
ncbi:transcriptional regulator [Corynebacterium diphtheriae]|nr:transcriptional regulator [Corynebacterium diphtheriae]OSQ14810.1 transcriptional regulator [Corynebacterium diphtheriae]RLP16786.1 XRE family transcriptional regulator [Corynebacterium diphtheriae]CAB0542838.1 transcriptional regulator [Corynebacterium diphtheriae]